MSEKILKSITPIFQEVFDQPNLKLTNETSANNVKNWDSLNHITLIVELESLTGLSFSTDEMANLSNVGDFVELMKSKGYNG